MRQNTNDDDECVQIRYKKYSQLFAIYQGFSSVLVLINTMYLGYIVHVK